MGHKVFVSYKYADYQVQNLPGQYYSTVRNYVDVLEEALGKNHVYKGEQDGEDLSYLSDEGIWDKLKDRIYDSSVTIVLISKGMRETVKRDRSQWIPWEVRYSLCEYPRQGEHSHTNGLLYVALPDIFGSYDYFIEKKTCCATGCNIFDTENLFAILKRNMFNKKEMSRANCEQSGEVYNTFASYAIAVRWSDFMISDFSRNFNIEMAFQRAKNKGDYNICTKIDRT